MKLPLRIELWDDGETFDGIVDATGEYIITTDCNFYGPQREDAEFIVAACNSAMTEARAREILGNAIDTDYIKGDAFKVSKSPWSREPNVQFTGVVTLDELEAIAWWMRNKQTAKPEVAT